MDFSNDTATNILDKDNWLNSLLIKDEKGSLSYFKGKGPSNFVKKEGGIDVVSEGNFAPLDDSFHPGLNIKGGSQDKAELVFHPHDQEELNFFAQNIPVDDSKKYSVEKIVARIIDKQNLALDDKNQKIFTNILYNFFRSRKSAVIVRELLTKNVLIKNKPLASDTVDTILSIIKGIKNKIDLSGGLVVNQLDLASQDKYTVLSDETLKKKDDNAQSMLSAQDEIRAMFKGDSLPSVSHLEKLANRNETVKKVEATALKETDKKDIKPSEGFAIPSVSQPSKMAPEKPSAVIPIVKEQIKSQPIKEEKIDVSLPKVLRPGMAQTPKRAVSDVITPVKEYSEVDYYSPKVSLTGPVQELQSFNLVGFRRLGNTPEERVQKVFDKINLLEQDSYTKKAQGIGAWRSSPVYKLYLKLGAESMVAGREVADYIAERENKNEETLSLAEFSAISDLNKQLRF